MCVGSIIRIQRSQCLIICNKKKNIIGFLQPGIGIKYNNRPILIYNSIASMWMQWRFFEPHPLCMSMSTFILLLFTYLDHQIHGQEVPTAVSILVISLLLSKLLMVACVGEIQCELTSHWQRQHEPGPGLGGVGKLHTF